jgi:hypothetical protein
MKTLFQPLSQAQKIDFFVKCQELMIKYHPTTSFVIRENSLKPALDAFANNINSYKGFCHADENICLLWNYVFISDENDEVRALVENGYKEPNPNYNAVSMDFVVCRHMRDYLDFIKQYNEDRIKFILSVKYGKAKIVNKDKLINGMGIKL